MDNILDEIFMGEYSPLDNLQMSDEYREHLKVVTELEEKILNKLDEEGKVMFEKISEEWQDMSICGMKGAFIEGVKFGWKIKREIKENE